ncbi:MAG TPA: hypothetical protein VII73_01020 [Caulobacteraceae bacterium]
MSLSDLASIGNFISGVAVVITLIFLLAQTRQTNRNQKALMQSERSTRSVAMILKVTDARQSEIVERAERGDLSLTPAEIRSYFSLCGAFYGNYEDSFLQFKSGTLDRDSWNIDLAALKQFASLPSARVAWTFVRSFSGGPYKEFVDKLMLESKGVPPPDLSETWKSRIAEELSAA